MELRLAVGVASVNLVEAPAQLIKVVDARFLHDSHIVRMMSDTHAVALVISDFVFVDMHN